MVTIIVILIMFQEIAKIFYLIKERVTMYAISFLVKSFKPALVIDQLQFDKLPFLNKGRVF